MKERYVYKGADITLDIIMKTEDVVRQISLRENLPFDSCLEMFVATRTYKNLQNTMTALWAESAEFIVDEYYRETQK